MVFEHIVFVAVCNGVQPYREINADATAVDALQADSLVALRLWKDILVPEPGMPMVNYWTKVAGFGLFDACYLVRRVK